MNGIVPRARIPIPYDWAALLLMGFGVFFWLFVVIDFLGWVNARIKGKDIGKVWDRKMEEFRPNTLRRRLGGNRFTFLLGFGLFFTGYAIYTDFSWNFLGETANFSLVLAAASAFIIVIFIWSRYTRKTRVRSCMQ